MLVSFLRIVLHFPQSAHDVDWIFLSGDLLDFGIIDAHEYVVLLSTSAAVYMKPTHAYGRKQ